MKTYAIIELGDQKKDWSKRPNYYDDVTGKLFPVLAGSVELMVTACDLAGVIVTSPREGDWYFDFTAEKWTCCKMGYVKDKRYVIREKSSKPLDINDDLEYAPGGIL